MNPGFQPPPPPDDEAADPLLAALRQRLGDYGQAPPPGAWAAIRQRVSPPPPPRPWWRRRHLLAVLGLLLCCLLPGKLGEWAELRRAREATTTSHEAAAKHAARQPVPTASGSQAAYSAASQAGKAVASPDLDSHSPANATLAAGASASLPQAAKTAATAVPSPAAAGRPPLAAPVEWAAGKHAARAAVAAARRPGKEVRWAGFTKVATTSYPRRQRLSSAVALRKGQPARARRPHRELSAGLGEAKARAGQPVSAAVVAATQGAHSLASRTRQAQFATAAGSHQAASQDVILDTVAASSGKSGSSARRRAQAKSVGAAAMADSSVSEAAAGAGKAALVGQRAAFLPSLPDLAGPLDLLALKIPCPPLAPAAPLATLVARPDSAPVAQPVRRWALLVLAGPTVSYRTLGPAPTLAAGHPDFARLERPALGLGAQVQVRRVLSGRWALAVGLGYHEYATRLALSLKDTASVHQRDTYRLLTVPVQASYALGVPKSRLSKALLLGLEPGWYLGGRSTEGSGCGCEQQAYAAAGSPYRSLSVAFSLGLDVRYRLGGAGGRWQWLVQPTGRYVATPFVRADAVGFTRRQPFSLGFLTGFSWDVR